MMRDFHFWVDYAFFCSLDSHQPLIAPLCDFTKTNMQKYCTNKTRRTERSCIASLQLSPSQPHGLFQETGMWLGNMWTWHAMN